jgi:hypothetical protein
MSAFSEAHMPKSLLQMPVLTRNTHVASGIGIVASGRDSPYA